MDDFETHPVGTAARIAGKTIADWIEFARRDDCLDVMVPSDLRHVIYALTRANAATAAAYEVAAREVECGCGAGPCQDTANCAAKDAAAIRALATPDQTAALDRLIADAVKPYAEALAWYGEQARLARLIHSEGDAGRNALQADGGKRANALLAASKKGGV